MNDTLAALALLLASPSMASEVYMQGAVGVFHSGEKGLSETKLATLGLQTDLGGPFRQRFSTGLWLDNGGEGRTNSGFGSYQLGFAAVNETIEAHIFTGPAYITSPDNVLLGGHFQFCEDVYLGVTNSKKESLGVFYKHFSSAGLEMPNIGRDFMGLEARITF